MQILERITGYQHLEDKYYLLAKSQEIFQYHTEPLHTFVQKRNTVHFIFFFTALNNFKTRTLKCGTSLVPIMFLRIQSCHLFYFAVDVPTVTLKKKNNTLLLYQSPKGNP